jgi:general secretion pathway protein F
VKVPMPWLKKKLSERDREFFLRQLGVLLKAGIPLDRAITLIAAQSPAPLSEVLEDLRTSIREGASLNRAMARRPEHFSESFRSLIAAGENAGSLVTVVGRVADAMQANQQLKQGIAAALAYPLIVTAVALMVVVMLMSYVVPQIVTVLDQQAGELPLLTRMLIVLSAFLSQWGWSLLLLVLAGALAFVVALRRFPKLRTALDRSLLGLPLMGPLLLSYASSQFAATLAISLAGGVSLMRALDNAAAVVGNRHLSQQLRLAATYVREGAELGRSLSSMGGFPPVLVTLIGIGERSGDLPRMLELAADQLTVDLRRKTALLTTFLEPALILIMGVVVLLIVLAVMTPLIEINTMIR